MRVLIAEDDLVLADGLLRALRASGCAVDQVGTGSEADAALAAHEFDLCLAMIEREDRGLSWQCRLAITNTTSLSRLIPLAKLR